ncbi:hypothetical protein [Trinickia violacea]|nr:hypothetical protein [Trinickia violacea]
MFATIPSAMATVTAMLRALKDVGQNATVAEMIGATTMLEKLSVVAGIYASYYTGAVIGSLIVATDAAIGCKNGSEAQAAARRFFVLNGLVMTEPMRLFFLRHPEVLNPFESPFARSFGSRAHAPEKAA